MGCSQGSGGVEADVVLYERQDRLEVGEIDVAGAEGLE